jgi:hypothetical protein
MEGSILGFVLINELKLIIWLFGIAILFAAIGSVAVAALIRHDRNKG